MKEKLHVVPHLHKVNKQEREKLNGHKALAIWFVGLSGSGKSTLSGALEQYLHENGIHTYLLDGDNVRSGINSDLDFTMEGRKENVRRIGEIMNLFVNSGLVTISAFISPLAEDREKAKKVIGEENFVEVYVKCPIEVCESRDVKGLYAKARAGEITNFTGINSPFEEPENPDVIVETDKLTLEEGLNKVLSHIKARL